MTTHDVMMIEAVKVGVKVELLTNFTHNVAHVIVWKIMCNAL